MQDKSGIVAENLNIGYASDLIRDICLEVKSGHIVSLIGPNGCGKTTLLRTLTGQLKERGGTVYLCGSDRSALPATDVAKRLSMVMTQKLHPALMTCREVVEIGRYPYTGALGILSEDDRIKVSDAMKRTDVEEIADSFFGSVSDGQKQRVLLARAICQEPEVLILDEPTSYLDIRHKIDLLLQIKSFASEKNVAVLMSVHELDIARNISDTVVALGEGSVLRIGTPDEVFKEPFIRKLYHIEDMDTSILGRMPWEDSEASEETQPDNFRKSASGKASVIMIQGTMSNAGKSVIAAGLCRIFSDDGYKVAPFKSQNMALNSFITDEGLEIGRAQAMQAECARIAPSYLMNPILLKPTTDRRSQVIVNGKVESDMTAAEYQCQKTKYADDIINAFDELSQKVDIIVVEGAGSPVEMNLKKDDIVNMGLAKMLDAPVLLVGDIDRGGVFAQLLGTLDLLEKDERDMVAGLIVNKFRGDSSLFEEGISILEKKGKKKVIGVVPFMDLKLDDEDSLSDRFKTKDAKEFDIAVIRLDHISNFTDFDVFEQLDDVSVRYVSDAAELEGADMIIIPGTKNTISDLKKIKENGIAEAIVSAADRGTVVFGICGGYQMLGRRIEDPDNVEEGGSVEGLNLLPVDTLLQTAKVQTNGVHTIVNSTGVFEKIRNTEITGYEIHMGKTEPFDDLEEFTSNGSGYCSNNVYGTYIHGFFDKKDVMCAVVESIAKQNGKCIRTDAAVDHDEFKNTQYNMLAEGLRRSLDIESIYKAMGVIK